MKICFVALEILGPFSGGGIATALAGQAEHHAQNHDVTVLYVHPGLADDEVPEWEDYFAQRNITFVRANFDNFYPQDMIPKRSFAVKQFLEAWDQTFDVIIFHDYLGLGYYTALARRLDLGFQGTHLGTVVHGPSEWARTLNMVGDDVQNIGLYEMERKQAEYSDFIVAPSQHILDWCAEQGWTLPPTSRAISNLLPDRVDLHSGLQPGEHVEKIEEVVFFGRLEIRKGFFTFLDAIKYMHKHKLTLPKKITFLGAFCTNSDRNSASSVLEYAESWDCDIQFLNNYNHEEAINYLISHRPLAVVPSVDESFGLTAYECLAFGIPTLFSDRGALSTLPTEAHRDAVLVEPKPHILGERIAEALRDGIILAGVHDTHLNAAEHWDAFLEELAATPPEPPKPWNALVSLDRSTERSLGHTVSEDTGPPVDVEQSPLVSVILVHHNRPSTLTVALSSLLAQTYENIEIVIVDDGSTAADVRTVTEMVERLDDPRVRLLRQKNRYLGAARNLGVRHANGTYLLFMDDDNFAMPNEIEVLTRVAVTSGADILNTVSRLFRSVGTERVPYDIYLPIGPSLPLALFGNTFGDANSLVRREVFERIGGFTEEYALGCEDYEFFNRAFLSGAKMQFVPELLFDYRADEESMMKELNSGKYIINQTRGVRPFFDTHRPIDLAQLRGVMRLGFYTAVDREYSYWIDQSQQKRRFSELEDQLRDLRYRPNSQQASSLVVKLLAAYGRIREAIALMERNDITPEDSMLREMQTMLARHDRRSQNTGQLRNSMVNGAFEFWSAGRRIDGISPYQPVANEWLIPSSKRRGALIVSQEQDNSLYGLSRARTDKFIRIYNAQADAEGYCFLSQRMMDVSQLIENEVDLSMLARSNYPGPLSTFVRITYEHGTENYSDVWPEKPIWLSEHWQMANLRFDLTQFTLDATSETSFVSVFFKVRTDKVNTLDLADMVICPHGENTVLGPYIRENERQRAEQRMFSCGKDARFQPLGNRNLRIDLPIHYAGRLGPITSLQIRGPAVLALEDGNYVEIHCQEAKWMKDPDDAKGHGYLHVVVDREVGQVGTAMEDFLVVYNYLKD